MLKIYLKILLFAWNNILLYQLILLLLLYSALSHDCYKFKPSPNRIPVDAEGVINCNISEVVFRRVLAYTAPDFFSSLQVDQSFYQNCLSSQHQSPSLFYHSLDLDLASSTLPSQASALVLISGHSVGTTARAKALSPGLITYPLYYTLSLLYAHSFISFYLAYAIICFVIS